MDNIIYKIIDKGRNGYTLEIQEIGTVVEEYIKETKNINIKIELNKNRGIPLYQQEIKLLAYAYFDAETYFELKRLKNEN